MLNSELKELRKDYAKKTARIIKRNTELDDKTILEFAIDLERFVFNAAKNLAKREGELIFDDMKNYTLKFVKYYEGTYRPILININPKSYVGNVDLIKSIGNKTLEPERLVKLAVESPQSLHYNKHRDHFKLIEQQEDILFNKNLEFSSDERCKKCKSNKCVMTQAQLRSADEPMTTLVSCLSCGNKWQY